MKSLDRQSLEEQTKLVSRYVAGDLSRSERAEFEAWLVASPELASEVEMERRLRRGIASAARRGWLDSGARIPATFDRRWRVAIAAGVLLSFAVGVTLTLHGRAVEAAPEVQARHASERTVLAIRTVRLGSVRGVSTSPDINVARADAPTQLVIEPDVVALTCEDGSYEIECAGGTAPQTPAYEEYEMELASRSNGNIAWRSPAQMPTARTPLSFAVRDPGSLDAGDYDVLVRGRSPEHEEVVARFWLRVTAQ
jgi:hypothetical protein